MHYHGVRFLEAVDFSGVNMNAMTSDGVRPQDAFLVEPFHRAEAVLFDAVRFIASPFGDVNVVAQLIRVRFTNVRQRFGT